AFICQPLAYLAVLLSVSHMRASRGIGLETVKAALEAGHSVCALARSARRIPIDRPKLEKNARDALETATVKRALSVADFLVKQIDDDTFLHKTPVLTSSLPTSRSEATRPPHRRAA